jgi:hypothetical protein
MSKYGAQVALRGEIHMAGIVSSPTSKISETEPPAGRGTDYSLAPRAYIHIPAENIYLRRISPCRLALPLCQSGQNKNNKGRARWAGTAMQPLSMRGAHTNFPLPSGRACCQSTAPLSWDDISPSPHWVSRQRSGNARGGRSPPDSPRPPLPVPCFVLVRHTVWAPNARRLDGECNVVGVGHVIFA